MEEMDFSIEKLVSYCDERTKSLIDKEGFCFNFGKYNGYHVTDVFKDDPQYLKYVYRKAKYRLPPRIHQFIIDNNKEIKAAIAAHDLKELDVF